MELGDRKARACFAQVVLDAGVLISVRVRGNLEGVDVTSKKHHSITRYKYVTVNL